MVFSSKTNSFQSNNSPIVVLLGVGGKIGFEYKLSIVEQLSKLDVRLIVVESQGFWAIDQLISTTAVHAVIEINTTLDLPQQANVLQDTLIKIGVTPQAIVTYREEWLQLRSYLCEQYKLPHQPISAVQISQDKD